MLPKLVILNFSEPLVLTAKSWASLVPKTPKAPKLLPPCTQAWPPTIVEVAVHKGAVLAPWETNTWPSVPAAPLGIKAERKFRLPKVSMVKRETPEEEATIKGLTEPAVEVPCTTKVASGVVVPMPTRERLVTLNMEEPVEEEMLKGSKAALPWMLKLMVEEVAPMPATVPSSIKAPAAVVVAPVYLTT